MPMGGLGSRFANAGYTTPKPLIEVDGKPMFLRALDSFSSIENAKHIFVIRKDQDDKYNLKESIIQSLPDADVFILDHDTAGAVETCLVAASAIDDALPITIADCDIYFESQQYFTEIEYGNADGLLVTFKSSDPRYSYAEVGKDGKVMRTAEKIAISDNALLGGYFFRSGALFKQVAYDFVDSGLPEGLKEFYMSHLFNLLIQQGKNVSIASADVKHIFGTPEELMAYQKGN